MIDLTGGPCVYKRLSGCGSGTEYLAVTPWGDFYPCHQFVGQEDFCLGNVYEGVKRQKLSTNSKMQRLFQEGVQPVLCTVLLQRRMRGKLLQFHR